VIRFAINYRPTRGSISPQNTEVSEEIATHVGKNCRHEQPHSHLTPPPGGNPANIRMHLIFRETRLNGLHFIADSVGLSSFKFVQWVPKDGSFLHWFAFWLFKVVQGHPRLMILVPIESTYATSY